MSKHPKVVPTQGSSSTVTAQFQQISSPYPPPVMLDAFERHAPGSVVQVLDTTKKCIEANIEYQQTIAAAQIEHDRYNRTTARWLIGLIILGSFVLVVLHGDLKSYALLIGELTALAGAFIYSKK